LTEAAEQRPVTSLRGVGEALAARLAKIGVTQVQDLLFLLPTRYEDRTCIVPLGGLTPADLEWPALLRKLDRLDPGYRD